MSFDPIGINKFVKKRLLEDIPSLGCLVGYSATFGWAEFFERLHSETVPVRNEQGEFTENLLIERQELMKLMWDAFFDYNGNPEEMFKKYREEGCCWGFGESNFLPDEIEMHKMPRVFELIDYFLELTEYRYVEKFKTHCCVAIWRPGTKKLIARKETGEGQGLGIPVFHMAMDYPCSVIGRDIYKEAVKEIGEKFFKERYPRFFDYKKSTEPGHAFVSKGEKEMAFRFQTERLGNNIGWDEFEKETKVVYDENTPIEIPDKIELS